MISFSRIIVLLLCSILIQGCYRILPSQGGGQISYIPERQIDPQDVLLPDGFEIEVVSTGLTFPTAITFNNEGVPFVIEAGYSYGEVFLEPKLLKILPDGETETVFTGKKNGPWNGVTFNDGFFYIAEGGELEGGKILKVNESGEVQVLVENLPSLGDHHTNGPVVKEGYVYFGQGTATNSAVVGKDNADFGWLWRFPEFHDIPCKDVKVKEINYFSSNILTADPDDKALTGPYSPYNYQVKANQVIKGSIPCNGAIMKVPVDGGDAELVAWGLRNPYGLALSANDELFITENSYDVRGSRPVWGTGDVLWKIEEGIWYGWPDFNAGVPIHVFEVPGKEKPMKILAEHPNEPPKPVAKLGVHSSSNGIVIAKGKFEERKYAFVAQFGDMAPGVGKVIKPVGYKVVRVNLENGVIDDFAVNKGERNGPATWLKSGGLERPISVQIAPDGALYVVDFGILTMSEEGAKPYEKTGVIWKITRKE
ncbi:MAG: PQQ-dependent sugar dehydrogenase [Candidatus Cyclobacteriaceae bacterium M2_1C_046]